MLIPRLFHLLQLPLDLNSIRLTQQAHALSFTLNLSNNSVLASKLISAYSHFNLPLISRRVFDSFTRQNPQNVFLWNSLLSSYCNNYIFSETISLFGRMQAYLRPDNFTLAIVSKAAAEIRDLDAGRSIHCLVIKHGFASDAVLSNCVMRLYAKGGPLDDARKVFDEMTARSVVSWNSIISEYASLEGREGEVWKLLKEMQEEGMQPDAFTVCTILPLSWSWSGTCGREVHCYVLRHDLGLDMDVHMGSCLINMYLKGRMVDVGRRVFDMMSFKNVVTWTTMINGFMENAQFEEALDLFRMMQLQGGILPNKVSLVSVLPAIGSLARLVEGKQVHAFTIRMELSREPSLNNALIDMYSKCGGLDGAMHVFDDKSWCKDVISWGSMISCYGIHGKGEEAVILFNRMCSLGIQPDNIISVGILSACGRAGLASEGFEIYKSLVKNYGVVPTAEICSCIVDMLGRAGRLSAALNFIYSVPQAHGPSVWGALFDSSVIHNNCEIQDVSYRALVQLEPENPSNFVSFSNLHASSGRWDTVAEVRKRMKERSLKKIPGLSSISIDRGNHSFIVADKSHSCSDLIYAILDDLLLIMKEAGYIPKFDTGT